MNTIITSKEDILAHSRELIRRRGWGAVNIRSVAAACGVSVGAVYYYFGSKAELAAAAVESVWRELFHLPPESAAFGDTRECVRWLFQRMEYGSRRYPGFFTLHSLGFLQEEKSDGRRRMEETRRHILDGLCSVLRRDPKIRPGAFDRTFTAETFAELLFSLLLSALLRQSCDPGPVLEIVERTLYAAADTPAGEEGPR